jgi:hypothetical protein
MNEAARWRDSGHLERAVETAGGQKAFDAAVAGMLADLIEQGDEASTRGTGLDADSGTSSGRQTVRDRL